MAFSANQFYSSTRTSTFAEDLRKSQHISPSRIQNFSPCKKINILPHNKPLYISAASGFGYAKETVDESKKSRDPLIQCNAYEARRAHSIPISIEFDQENAAQNLKIGVYFATWWALSVVFNIYNKKVLNAFPFPWLTSTLSLAAGSIIMLVSWATRVAEAPETDLQFWKNLFPVAVAHTIGHVAATVSMSKVAVSFTHIIKSGEPAFSVLVSRFLLGETFPMPVYLSLLPIIGGCALSAAAELNFNLTGFMGAMVSNLAFVFRNISSKRGMNGKSVGGMNYYACLSMLSLVILTPFAIAMEGPQLWAIGWQQAVSQIGPNFVWEYNEENFSDSFLHCNFQHSSSTYQCPWCSHCNFRHFPLLSG